MSVAPLLDIVAGDGIGVERFSEALLVAVPVLALGLSFSFFRALLHRRQVVFDRIIRSLLVGLGALALGLDHRFEDLGVGNGVVP